MKRFKVVQDASGVWGIVDTLAVDFAPYDFKGSVCRWVDIIREHAISLNLGRLDREDFSWEQYEARS